MTENIPITVAYGDGIGPEIMTATLDIIKAAGARIDIEEIEIGEKVYKRGNTAGIEPSSWESLLRTKVFLKAPITTPQGGGFKSLNVTTRKTLGLYANVRPCISYHPFVEIKYPKMDLVIIRENEEDLYAGVEYRLSDQVMAGVKLITDPGSEKIIRYAFEYAHANNRKKVTCFMKDNIMKMTDGLFHRIFDKVGEEYPDIEKESWIVDIGAAKMATSPESFDVIVMENLYGDILSDVTAQMTGSVGLAGSANVGMYAAMFEAIHGSAPRRAGQNLANPSGLLLGAVMMLAHINQPDVAAKVHNAWLKTIEDGIHTYDIYREGKSRQKAGTKEFTKAVIERIGQKPSTLKEAAYKNFQVKYPAHLDYRNIKRAKKEIMGADIFIQWAEGSANELGEKLKNSAIEGMKLLIISNRGIKVWPEGKEQTFCVDSWICRFESVTEGKPVTNDMIIAQLQAVKNAGYDFVNMAVLCTYDGERGYTLAQGQ
ncbi:MAG TPA: NADP-dependent isocitrate dehydrogenase [Ignavibacteria bacterium]|jgi:isocitrate dehydrogenase